MASPAAVEYFERLQALRTVPDLAESTIKETGLSRALKAINNECASDEISFCALDGEQLVWQASKVIWCSNTSINSIFDFDEQAQDAGTVLQATFAFFKAPTRKHAAANAYQSDLAHRRTLFGPFVDSHPGLWTERNIEENEDWATLADPEQAFVKTICVVFRDLLWIKFPETGQIRTVHIPFLCRKVAPATCGLFVERIDKHALYHLSDPLAELSPITCDAEYPNTIIVGTTYNNPKHRLAVTQHPGSHSLILWRYDIADYIHDVPAPSLVPSMITDNIPLTNPLANGLTTIVEDVEMLDRQRARPEPDIDHELQQNSPHPVHAIAIDGVSCSFKQIATLQIQTNPTDYLEAVFFDTRQNSTQIAVVQEGHVSLFEISTSDPSASIPTYTPQSEHSADSWRLAKLTRPTVDDFIIRKNDNQTCFSLPGLTVAVQSRSESLYPRTETARRCLAILAERLPPQDFCSTYLPYLVANDQGRISVEEETSSLMRSLLYGQACAAPALSTGTSFERLLQSLQRPHSQALLSTAPLAHPSTDSRPALKGSSQSYNIAMRGLHQLLEDMRLTHLLWDDMAPIAEAVALIADHLHLPAWKSYYARQGHTKQGPSVEAIASDDEPSNLQDILLRLLLNQKSGLNVSDAKPDSFWGPAETFKTSTLFLDVCGQLGDAVSLAGPQRTAALRKALETVHAAGWTRKNLNQLADGPGLVIKELCRTFQSDPPLDWPVELYDLIGREDVSAQLQSFSLVPGPSNPPKTMSIDEACESVVFKPVAVRHARQNQVEFGKEAGLFDDRRLEEAARTMSWTTLCKLDISEGSSEPDPPSVDKQAKIATTTAHRTMAIAPGAGLFDYGTRTPVEKDGILVPGINYKVLLLPFSIQHPGPDSNCVSLDQRVWPEFHIGAATALSANWQPDQKPILGFDLSFSKPTDFNAKTGGYLFGLGLTGQLRDMVVFQAFSYLDPKHEAMSIGVLLGLAAAYRGTCDPKVSSLLSVHLAALLPQRSAELNISLLVQTAALLGMGLLYFGTARHSIADLMLKELSSIIIKHREEAESCRQAYALAAGFSLGMVMLCRGSLSAQDANNSKLVAQLQACLDSDGQHPLPGMHSAAPTGIDVSVTSPAATIALTLMYLQTGRKDISDLLFMPSTSFYLDYIRPDLLMLRTIGRALIMWDEIKPNLGWVRSRLPGFLYQAWTDDKLLRGVGLRTTDNFRAVWSIQAGAAFAIGLRYAGSASLEAHKALLALFDELNSVKSHSMNQIKRHVRQSCLSVISLALGMVFAGTGDLEIFRRLRLAHGRLSDKTKYAQHMATHQAIGLLFMGKGTHTLGTSPGQIACLFCAFYPFLPTDSADNKAHLQAARHLWVFAAEPRALQVKDVVTKQSVPLAANVYLKESTSGNRVKLPLSVPTLFPELRQVESIRIDSVRYWPLTIDLSKGSQQMDAFLSKRTVFVKKHAGRLDYLQDPKGILGMASGTDAEAAVTDLGTTALCIAKLPAWDGDTADRAPLDHSLNMLDPLLGLSGLEKHDERLQAYSDNVSRECNQHDKLEVVPNYISMYASSRKASSEWHHAWNLAFVTSFYTSLAWRSHFADDYANGRLPLIEPKFIEHLDSLSVEISDVARHSIISYLQQAGTRPNNSVAASLISLSMPPEGVLRQLQVKVEQFCSSEAGKKRPQSHVRQAAQLLLKQTLERIALPGKGLQISKQVELMMSAWVALV